MTFESMIENININADNEPLSVKVSYGDELRRTTFTGTSYEALRDSVAKLFGLDVASVVLRYQDDDGDKITMSTDGELVDALRGAKEKKLLRLFVDVKVVPAPVAPEEVPAPAPAPADAGEDYFNHPFGARRFGGPMRGGFRGPFGYGPHRGGPHHGPHHAGPHGHHHGGPHGHHHGGPHGHGPHGPGPHHGPHHGFGPHHAGPHGHPHGPHPPHGFPAGPDGQQPPFPPHFGRGGPYGNPWAHKAHKHAMKEHKHAMKEDMKEQKHAFKAQIKLMKENATTPDDFLAIKEYKQQMRAEWKNQWQQGKHCGDKFDKYDKKKYEKKCKKDKKDKKDRFIAKHVADVTIPDNSELPADTPATKTWRLRNVGTTAWPADSQLIFISRRGDNLNGPEKVNVGAVEPQQEIDVSLTFITPSEPGRYIGYYRMATADGSKFGQRVWVSFLIPHTPAVTPASPLVNVTYTTTTISSPLAGDIAMD